jgi:hypothetical protein
VVSSQINPDRGCLHANKMSTSSKTSISFIRFRPLAIFNWPDTTVLAGCIDLHAPSSRWRDRGMRNYLLPLFIY